MNTSLRNISFEENPTIRIADRIHEIPRNLYFLFKRLARTKSTANTIATILWFDREIGIDEQCKVRLNNDWKRQLQNYNNIFQNSGDVQSLEPNISVAIDSYQQIIIQNIDSTEVVAGDYLEYIRKLAGNRNTLAERLWEHFYCSQQTKSDSVSIGAKSLLRLSNFVSMMQKIKSNNYLFDPTKKSIT